MYTEHYGLTDRPFQLTPDARFWYESRTHKKAMAYLGYGLAQGEGFIVVTGEIGAGKSTLVAHLLATIDRTRVTALNLVSTQVEGDDMLRLVAQSLGLAPDGVSKAWLLDAIEQQFQYEARSGKRTLLIVDEAQNLPHSALEELRMLSNFQLNGRSLVQILLTGQPELRDRLAPGAGLEQLRQRVIATHHLDAMEANEVEPYMVHRLSVAGWNGRPAIDAGAFAAIHRHSGGTPRRINQLANRLLLHAAIEQTTSIDAAAVDAVAADLQTDRAQPVRATAPSFTLVPQPDAAIAAATGEPIRDLALERRLASAEAKLEEQEQAVRRVLSLLVDWVESEAAPIYRHNAA